MSETSFQIFLSNCAGDGPETVVVDQFYELLCQAFRHEKEDRHTVAIEYDRRTPVHAGNEVRHECVEKVKRSDLVICCFFPRYLEARYFREEVKAALNEGKPIIEIRFSPSGESPYVQIEKFDRRLVEREGSGRPLRVVFNIRYDISSPASVREAILRYVAGGGLLVDAIRKQIIERAERDLKMFSRADKVIDDLAEKETTSIRLFLYDGGSTIRRLQAHEGFRELLDRQRENLEVQFLYVDTACKAYISETPEYKGSEALQAMDDSAYSAVYEALCRRSGLIHNQSPNGHLADVTRSEKTLRALRDKYHFQFRIRKTSQLPLYRLIISQHYVYYTHIFPQFAEDPEQSAPDYYSLRLSTESRAGMTLIDHYESLWKSGPPESPDAR